LQTLTNNNKDCETKRNRRLIRRRLQGRGKEWILI